MSQRPNADKQHHEQRPRKGPVGRPWVKGQSGNPKGRPRTGMALAETVRELAAPDALVAIALRIANNPESTDDAKIRALTWLRDSGYQRPPAGVHVQVEHTPADDGEFDNASDDELDRAISEANAVAVAKR